MTLLEELSAPRPETAFNYKAEPTPIRWPKGKTIARTGMVHLIMTSEETFAVVYALDVHVGLRRDKAAQRFGQCCIHQAECEGLL